MCAEITRVPLARLPSNFMTLIIRLMENVKMLLIVNAVSKLAFAEGNRKNVFRTMMSIWMARRRDPISSRIKSPAYLRHRGLRNTDEASSMSFSVKR